MPSMQEVLDGSEAMDSRYPRGSTWRVVDPDSDYNACILMLIYGPRLAIIHAHPDCAETHEALGQTFSGTHNRTVIQPVQLEVQDALVL